MAMTLEEVEENNNQLRADKRALDIRIQGLENELSLARIKVGDCEQLQRECDAYKRAKQENDARFCGERDDARRERDEYKAALHAMRALEARTNEAAREVNARNEELREEKAKLQNELALERFKSSDARALQNEVARTKELLERAVEDANRAGSERNQIRAEYQQCMNEKVRLQHELDAIVGQHATLLRDNDEMRAELERTRAMLPDKTELCRALAESQAERDRLAQRDDEQVRELGVLHSNIASLREDHNRVCAKYADMRQHVYAIISKANDALGR